MTDRRITNHPILPIPQRKSITFYWQEKQLTGYEGETISSALYANGIKIFGHHHKDGSPMGIFCANGQCSQCMVIANGTPVKSCMESLTEGMTLFPNDHHPELPFVSGTPSIFTNSRNRYPGIDHWRWPCRPFRSNRAG